MALDDPYHPGARSDDVIRSVADVTDPDPR